jgi:integrase
VTFIIQSDDFQIDRKCIFGYDGQSKITLKGFPTFYSTHGKYICPINLWINYLVNVKKSKNINSNIRAIKRYWSFLENNNLIWDDFPRDKSLKPTYRFRNDNLLKAVKKGELCASTASNYMLHVIKFYEWAGHEQLIKISEHSKPFEYEYVNINNYGMMSHINRFFVVRTTDLKIKTPNRGDKQSLNPLSENELSSFIKKLKKSNEEFKIHQLLQLQSGLRVSEACTFPLSAVIPPPYERKYLDVNIGPHNGVKTKYGKKRTIEVPSSLMHRMYLYSISEYRLKKKDKDQVHLSSAPLLLNQSGRPITTDGIQRHFHRFRIKLRNDENIIFNHRTHDLRSTYATFKLSSLLKYIEPSDAMTLLMGWLGHKDEKTTWKYLRYLNKDKIHQNAISMLDSIMDDALIC